MIRLCILLKDRMFQADVADAQEGVVHTPLSTWEPARIANGVLSLPRGWQREGDDAVSISLREESNHLLCCQETRAVLMIRDVPEGSMAVETVGLLGRFTVGRSAQHHICCRENALSACHGVFSFTRSGQLRYEDASKNGTFVNDSLLWHDARLLQPGDRLDFPPLMQVTVTGVGLQIRYPRNHGQLQLPPLPTATDGELLAAVYLPLQESLHYVSLPASLADGASLLRCILAQLPDEKAALLPSAPLLRLAGDMTLISPMDPVRLRPDMTFHLS